MAALFVENGVYFIQNVGTGTVVDLKDGSNAENTKIQGWKKRELDDVLVPAQLWVISKTGNKDNDYDTYTIQNANSRTYMTLPEDTQGNYRAIVGSQRYGESDRELQEWKIVRNDNVTAYTIMNVDNEEKAFVDLLNGGKDNGTDVYSWDGVGVTTTNTHQLWHIVRA